MREPLDLTDIGKKIRLRRKEAGLTQSELGSKAFHVSENAGQVRIKNFELGIGRLPTEKELLALSAVLNIRVEELLECNPFTDRPPLCLNVNVLKYFPWLQEYIEMANLAIEQEDVGLVARIATRIADRLYESAREIEEHEHSKK
jgi:transcriptional regulator with XRE-family HTH domain